MCHSAVRDNLGKVGAFVVLLESRYNKEIKDFNVIRFYAIGFFFMAAIFIGFYVRQEIIKPLRRLRDAAREVGQGSFDVRQIDIKSNDEIGRLSESFNEMSRSLNELFAHNSRYASIIGATSDFVATALPDGRVNSYNRAARKMLGIGENEDISNIRIPDTHPEWAKRLVLDEGIPAAIRDGIWSGETAFLDRGGREIPVSQVIIAHKNARGEVEFLSTIARDITERKAMEAQLRQSQKMEAIGRFAGGIAHDFNNLLTVMIGHSELLLLHQKPGSPEYNSIITIQETANRAKELTRQLLAFSREQVLEPVVLDLNEVLRGMSRMFSRLMSENVEQHLDLDPAVKKIKAGPSQIEQVILNLVVNAQDAMPDGGKLTISTKDRCLDEAYCRLHVGVMPGAYVLLSISDTGVGMTDQVREHIFEPFYTTKGPEEGTGLGLSTVYRIVKQMGGHIYVYSEVGHGTVFRIHLPAHNEADQEETPAAPIESEGMPGGQETILVAEDDPSLLELAVHILERLGYTVLSACDGEEAMAKAREYQGRVDLLLTDVGLPGKKGFEIAEEIKEKYPELKVLFMSGYADDRLAQPGAPKEPLLFLPKPFTPSSMARKVREVLDS
ncbi:MAG: ATP-binding protein [bacterium]